MSLSFSYPWLLLLIIPSVAFTLIPYFRMARKYRKTRNRIISMTLHLLIMLLSISVLSGATIHYDEPYLRSEILILVDGSSSSKLVEQQKNDFVQDMLRSAKDEYKIGIIIFGYGQPEYVAELSHNTDFHFRDYMNAGANDESGTDIAGALRFAKEQFSDVKNGKIVLLTDGLETDGDALSAIMSLAAEGVKVDAAVFSGEMRANEVQLVGVELPTYAMSKGDEIEISLTIQSSYSGAARVMFYDNEILGGQRNITTKVGEDSITFTHTLADDGLHEFKFIIESSWDIEGANNVYFHYLYLEKFDKVLILERTSGESYNYNQIISADYDTEVLLIGDAPTDLDTLRAYDQVILFNIANADMPSGFIELLHTYVYDYGGGMLTVGGNKVENGHSVQNTYLPSDMYEPDTKRETLYQRMLPVQSIEYTPPLGLVIVIDRSGSMDRLAQDGGSQTLMDLAKQGASEVVGMLSERDHVGIITFSTTSNEEIAITPVTQQSKILNAISGITAGGDTVYFGAIEKACRALQELRDVDRRHIIFVTDGKPQDDPGRFTGLISDYNASVGITLSVISIGVEQSGITICENMAAAGNGRYYDVQANNVTSIPNYMKMDVQVDDIAGYNPTVFTPIIKDFNQIVRSLTQDDIPELGGFYGTKKRDSKTDVVETLGTTYSPIYAHWKYGQGTVGSFMSDLSGDTWSAKFMEADAGKLILKNIVKSLFPTKSLRVQPIQADFRQENYSTSLSIIASLEEGQYVEVNAINISTGNQPFSTITPALNNGFARCTLLMREPGLYRIDIEIRAADGSAVPASQHTSYQTFSYSKEYDMFVDREAGIVLVNNIAEAGKGAVLEAAGEAYSEVQFAIPREYDPRLVLIAIAVVLLLLDIAVRKFKFKWPHEIIRDRRLKKEIQAQRSNAQPNLN